MLEDVLTSLESLGLTRTEAIPMITDEPKIPYYLTSQLNKTRYVGKVFGQGFDTDDELAKVKSLAEFFERLCLYNPNVSKMIRLRHDLQDELVNPELFCNYSNEQLADKKDFLKRTRESSYRCITVDNVAKEEARFIPGQLVFLSNDFEDEFHIKEESISTGAAFGRKGRGEAFKAGLLEVIERDSCISAYLTRRRVNKIVDLPYDLKELLSYLDRYRLECHVFDVMGDIGVPVALSLTIDRSGIGPTINIGSNANINYHDAVKRAILESIQCRRTARIGNRKREAIEVDQIYSLDDRYRYWSSLDRINDLDFWINTNDMISYDEIKGKQTSINKTIEMIKSLGYNIFVADITLDKIADKGFEVVKVIVPEMLPLYIDERAKGLYSKHYENIKDDKRLKPHPFT